MSRYAEAEWRPIPGATIGTYLPDEDGDPALVIHSTEGATLAAAEAAYAAKDVVPHFTGDYFARRLVQHADTDQSASALRNEPGGVQTNRQGRVVQIELVGFAAESHLWPPERLAWVGRVILLICRREGIPLRWPPFVGQEAGTIATPTAPQRMSATAWRSFSGICGHQHVPENSHWDPGRLDVARALQLAEPTTGADDMTPEQERLLRRIHDALGLAGLDDTEAHGNIKGRVDALYSGAAPKAGTLIDAIAAVPGANGNITPDQLNALGQAIVAQLGAPLAGAVARLLAERLAE